MKNITAGIDFGTSNTTLGITDGSQVTMVALEDDKLTIPSAVFYDEDRNVYFGRAAIEEFVDGNIGRLLRSLKSVLGSDLMQEKTQVGNRRVSFTDILTGFVANIKQKAETQAGHEITSVVMGRPVYFVDNNPDANQRAQDTLELIARQAGFSGVTFQFEPIAAALAYESDLEQDEVALIVDIGGGTSDFSIVRVGPAYRDNKDRSADILANEGVHVGGTDLDKRLSLSEVMPHFGLGTRTTDGLTMPLSPFHDLATWHKIHFMYTRKYMIQLKKIAAIAQERPKFDRLVKIAETEQGHALAGRIEQAKIDLTDVDITSLDLGIVEAGFKVEANRHSFEDAISDEVQKIKATINATIAAAGLQAADISSVFMTGGSTAIPSIRQAIAHCVGDVKIVEGDRFGSVGYGLALQAQKDFS